MANNVLLELDDDFFSAEPERLPYFQVINAPKKFTSKSPFGWFIPAAEAEMAGFTPDSRWSAYTHRFESSGNTEDGYLTKAPRFVVLGKSEIEAYVHTPIGRRYAGPAYVKGNLVNYGAEVDTKTRYLVAFLSVDVDEKRPDSAILHRVPFQLSASGAFAGAFSEELGRFYGAMSTAYAKQRGRSATAFSVKAKAHCIVDIEFGSYAKPGKNPYLVPAKRLDPAASGEAERKNDRRVVLEQVAFDDIFVFPKSYLSDTVSGWVAEYADKVEPPTGGPAQEEPAASLKAFKAVGSFDVPALTTGEDGTLIVPFKMTGGASYTAFISPEFLENGGLDIDDLVGKTYEVGGVINPLNGFITIGSANEVNLDDIPY